MKYPFNKERAMKGDPVVTRDGRKAEFVENFNGICYPLYFKLDNEEFIWATTGGSYFLDSRVNDKDLFMLTPDPAPSAPIPFDWDKYNSGEWDVKYRNDEKPKAVHCIPEAAQKNILSIMSNGIGVWHLYDGSYSASRVECFYDLLLTPKQVTRWFNLYKDHNGRLSVSASFDSEPTAKQADYVTGYIGTYSYIRK